jgi:hypothetical protein
MVKVRASVAPQQPIPGGVVRNAVPHYRMARPRERRSIKLGQLIYLIIKFLAAPLANNMLVSSGLMPATRRLNVDFQATMRMIKDRKIADPSFLGPTMTLDKLQRVADARNESDHDDFTALFNNEAANLSVLKDFCTSLGNNGAALDVQRLTNDFNNGDYQSAFYFRFFFTPMYNEHVAFCISMIVFAVLSIYLATTLWEARQRMNPMAQYPPPMDLYKNLLYFKQELIKNINFLGPGGAARRDRELISACIQDRLDNRHSAHRTTFSDWVNALDDAIQLLNVFGERVRAREVEIVRDTLKTARRTGTPVTNALFPMLFR